MRLFKLWSIALLAVVAVAPARAWCQDPETSTVKTSDVVPTTAGDRFEGYLYLDTDGNPLPFQSNEEIEAFLAKAKIVETSVLGIGVTLPRKVVLQGDGFRSHAVFKDIDEERKRVTERINGRNHFSLEWHDWHGYDVAAYILDRLLGTDRVPPAVDRNIGNSRGSIRIWLEKTVTEHERMTKYGVTPPDSQRWNQQRLIMKIFDNLVANRDSNLGNLLIDPNWRAWFIDCSRCFGNTKTMYYPLEHIGFCERSMWKGLKNLDENNVREHLSPYLGKAQIKALLTRRETIVRHFQELIEEQGEEMVIYDVWPATVTAPWGED
jgi:hypothetical protein